MDEQQIRIRDDLRGLVTGDILVEDLDRAAFSTDAGILQIRPLAVLAPRTSEELVEIVKYAAERDIPVHPRGAGTGLAGESLGPGLMIDASRHLTKVLEVGEKSIRVQPGVRWSELQRVLGETGRMFAPDPVSGNRCTIGGMIATDAGGPHSLRYGTTGDYVLGMKVVLADGATVELGRESLDPNDHPAEGPKRELVRSIAAILTDHAEDIRREQPSNLIKPGGYHLRGVLSKHRLDLARLLVGSEGTLAIATEIELATLPVPRHRGMLLACFPTLEAAASAVVESLEYQPTACEMLDRRLLTLLRDSSPLYGRWAPENAEALLLLEQEGSNAENVRERILLMANRLNRVKRLATDSLQIFRESELNQCWELRNRATPRLGHAAGSAQPIPFIENTAVPPERLPEFLKRVQDVMKRYGVTASYSAHAGVGILHTRPLLDLRRADHQRIMAQIADEVLDAVLDCGGTNNGEHGVGLLRSGLLDRQYPALMGAFGRIKNAFDPKGILNPGRIVGAEPGWPTRNLRVDAKQTEPAPLKTELVWTDLPVVEMADRCNGCGACQTSTPSARMCPSFKAEGSELSSPRSKANLLRQVLSGELEAKLLSTSEFRRIADYCVNCKMCRLECPSAVDISKLMLEAKAANVAEQGLGWTDWFFANVESMARWGSGNALFANLLLANPMARWGLERMVGLSRRRRIPRFHHQTFLRRAAANGWTRKPRAGEPRRRVALLVDVFANHHDPQLAECAVRVLEHHRVRVFVHPGQVGSGMPSLAMGDLEGTRAALETNLAIFTELVREGFDVVSTEPTAALMFRDDAKNLVSDPDLKLLADHTYEFSEYMAVLAEQGKLREDLAPIPLSVAYHEPCHQRALLPRASTAALLQRIPKLRLISMNLGCSGMAGMFGMRADGFDASMLAGASMLERLRRDDVHLGVTQCSACRLQMEQGAGKKTLHPAKWLALSYGLVKRPEKLLQKATSGRSFRA